MGFFLSQEQAAALSAPHSSRPERKKKVITEGARGCDACPLQETWPRISTPQMPICHALDRDKRRHPIEECDVLLLGEGPGAEEDLEGLVFVGKTGRLLRKHLPMRVLDRIALTNTVRCRPPGNRTPTGQEGHCCSIYLEEDLARYPNLKYIVGLGGAPLMRFVNEASITQICGVRFPVQIGERVLWYYPVFHPSFILRSGEERAPQYPVFAADLSYFFKNFEKWPKPKIEQPKVEDVICVYDRETAEQLYTKLSPTIGIDLETSILRPYERGAKLLTAALSDGELTFAFPIDHPADPNDWGLDLLLRAAQEHVWVAHNAAFELAWMWFHARRLGLNWKPPRFEDSMALARLYHARESMLSLAAVSRLILGVNVKKLTSIETSKANWYFNYTLDEVLPYNGLDAWACVKVFQYLNGKAHKPNYERILGAIKSTTYMELAGVKVSQSAADELAAEWQQKQDAAQQKAKSIYEVKAFERDHQKEFNIGSPDDVGAALVEYGRIKLPQTAKGHYSTDDSVLAPIAESSPLARYTLDYREAAKHISTYVAPIKAVPGRYPDGILHPSYSTMLTATLRRSSSDPNIQNYPKRRHKELRRPVIAPPGHVLLACDMGQIDARGYGMNCKDRALCQSFIDDEDIHTYWVSELLDLYPDYLLRLREKLNETDENKLRKEGRNIIKTDFVFASFYGTNSKNCAARTSIPFNVIDELLEGRFWPRYPDARKWLKGRRAEYRDTGSVMTLTGRAYHGVMYGNEMINYPIQGLTADFVIEACNDLSALSIASNDPYLHPRIEIHDDLVFVAPDHDDRIDEYLGEIGKTMTKIRWPFQIVPLTVEARLGYDWSDLTEFTVIKGDYVR